MLRGMAKTNKINKVYLMLYAHEEMTVIRKDRIEG